MLHSNYRRFESRWTCSVSNELRVENSWFKWALVVVGKFSNCFMTGVTIHFATFYCVLRTLSGGCTAIWCLCSSYASFLTNDPLLFNVHVHVLNDVQIVKVVHNIKRTETCVWVTPVIAPKLCTSSEEYLQITGRLLLGCYCRKIVSMNKSCLVTGLA